MKIDNPAVLGLHETRRHALADLLWRSARRTPSKTAIVYKQIAQTYAELDDTVNRTANLLRQRGVAKGDRIAILSHNNHAFMVMLFALARLGAIAVPVNFMLNDAEVAYILGHCEAVGIAVEDALAPVAESALRLSGREAHLKVRGAILDSETVAPAGWESVQEWMQHDNAVPPEAAIADDDPIQIIYTSGTESRPKGATLSSRCLIAQYAGCIADGDMNASDVEIIALPLFHSGQQHCFMMPNIYLGATSIILPGADPAVILATIEKQKVNKLFCPPTVWISLLRHPDFDARDLSSLRKGYYGASVMPIETIRELMRRLPDLQLYNLYGQTEMSPLATLLGPHDQVRKLGSAGLPTLNVETIIVDEADRRVPPGTVGEIAHRGPQVMLGYWNDPEKTADVFRNGWFHSGDLGYMDEEGYLYVVDRKKDMIKTGGENVASREVEETIYQHPAVAEVAVFAVPHARWIEAVVAAVVPRRGHEQLTPEELTGFCRSRLAGYKTPKHVVIVPDLPRSASGKILKRDLRLRYADLLASAPV